VKSQATGIGVGATIVPLADPPAIKRTSSFEELIAPLEDMVIQGEVGSAPFCAATALEQPLEAPWGTLQLPGLKDGPDEMMEPAEATDAAARGAATRAILHAFAAMNFFACVRRSIICVFKRNTVYNRTGFCNR
jgi:hypothetical protein